MCRNTTNNKHIHYRTNSVKINDQIFLWIQKTYFWPTSPIFGAKFFKKIGLSCTTSNGFLASWQNPEKSNDQKTDVRRQGWTDPISQDPSSYSQGGGVNNKYNCSRLAFKSKNKMCGVGLIKNYSLSNSNYFMSAKKMPTQKLYYRFHVGKNGIHVSSFQKIVFFQIFN